MKELLSIQYEYYLLLDVWQNRIITSEDMNEDTWFHFLDEIEIFWRGKFELLDFCLDNFMDKGESIILGGQTYLEMTEGEHVIFSLLKKNCLIIDPFLKLSDLLRETYQSTYGARVKETLYKSFDSIYRLLGHKDGKIVVIPPMYLFNKEMNKEKLETLEKLYIKFLTSIFGDEFSSADKFIHKYNSIELIEEAVEEQVMDKLILNNHSDLAVSLSERILRFQREQSLFNDYNESVVFFIALRTKIFQLGDIILQAKVSEIGPCIWGSTPFYYCILLRDLFYQDSTEELLEVLISHYFYKDFPVGKLAHNSYEVVIKNLKNYSAINSVIEKIHEENLTIESIDNLDRIRTIIAKEIEKVITEINYNVKDEG